MRGHSAALSKKEKDMSNKLFLEERACPNCDYRKVLVSELRSQARCSYCHNLIEVSLKSQIIVGSGFVFLVFFLIYIKFLVSACIVLTLFGIYNVLLHQIIGSYFPLKCYDDDYVANDMGDIVCKNL